MSERNIFFLVAPSLKGESYKLELVQNKLEDYTEQSESYQCPTYSFDMMISSTDTLMTSMKCPSRNDKTVEFKKPLHEPLIGANHKYSEYIPFSYFTENQMSKYYNNDENVTSFLYSIKFKIISKSFISIEIGYDHLISLFDIYLSKVEKTDAFKSSIIGVGSSIFKNDDDDNEILQYRKVLNWTVEPGDYILTISENLWQSVNRELHLMRRNDQKIEFCLPFMYKIDIMPQDENDHTLEPLILSIFPSGKIIFIGEDEDLRVTFGLNKTPFTHKKQAITGTHNFINIIYTFYLSEKLTYRKSDFNIQPQEEGQIFADKVEGSDDGKEWVLTFLQIKLKQGYDYELKLKPNYLVDIDYKSFTYSKIFPIFRIELDKLSQLSLNKKMAEIREDVEKPNADHDFVEEPKKVDHVSFKNEVKSKCGKHGIDIFDNIFKKWLCSCTDGYTGKHCEMCYGVIDKVIVLFIFR